MPISGYKYKLWDYAFWIWFFTNMAWNHTLPSMIGQGVFLTVSIVKICKSHSYRIPIVLLFFLAFVACCYINVKIGASVASGESLFMVNVLLRNSLFGFLLYQYLRRLTPNQLCEVFIIAVFGASLLMLVVNYTKTGTLIMRNTKDGLNGNAMAVGNALAIICMFVYDRFKYKKYLAVALFLLIFCFLAGTRKAMVSIIIGLSIYNFLSKPSKIVIYVAKISFFIAVLYIILTEIPVFYNIMGSRLEAMFSAVNGGDGDGSMDTRKHLIENGISYFEMRPWTGWGINCFKEMPGNYGLYSHCNYVEILFSVGIPGTIIYYLTYISSFFSAIKCYLKRNKSKEILLSFSLVFCCLMVDYGMVSYFNRPTLLYVLIIFHLVDYSRRNYNV